ncbi:hypothetical protein LPY66_06075 [Dehalobacter sp. DCM]|uniref:hypothetical protein n=1 Tax=Dehalobacter sp. DCM TaxID=2907827 RepID=UPI003081B623|nr:hypothetical protein LPY66_06075 [Dehalobacter sp. DCM]
MKEREKRCCCKHCGGPLEIRVIIFNKYGGAGAELFCPSCEKIEFGTEPEIYEAAKTFVDELDFNYFHDLEENDRTYKLNISKVCEILSWGCKNWGILDKNGMKISLSPYTMQDIPDSSEGKP